MTAGLAKRGWAKGGRHNLPAIFVATCWPRSRLAIKLFMPSAAAAVAHERLNAFNLFMHLPHCACQLERASCTASASESESASESVLVLWHIVAYSVRCVLLFTWHLITSNYCVCNGFLIMCTCPLTFWPTPPPSSKTFTKAIAQAQVELGHYHCHCRP